MKMKLKATARFCALVVGACGIGISSIASAESDNQDLKQQVDMLQKKVEMLSTHQSEQQNAPAASGGHEYFERKSGEGMTILTRGGEVSIYGNLDVSLDDTTKGIGNMTSGGSGPWGNGGWMPAISTNLSFIGLRGFQTLEDSATRFVWQLETQIDVSAISGTSGSNSNTSSSVKGGLTSRNSFIGLSASNMGAFKIGKTDAPYKTSTSTMNPFSGMIGDYSAIMGNSGGDNRVEFATRLEHAIWYESPSWSGFTLNALVSPGQNRAYDSSNLASGEGDCTGGNIPGSGGTPVACNDGSFGTAYSVSAAYRIGGIYVTGAYEGHKKVNRTSDLAPWDAGDIADESAAKIGAQAKLSSGTTVSVIYEDMKRNVPAYLTYQNERQRTGYWLAASQELTAKDSVHFGWAHANKTPGDLDTHNTTGGANPDNMANMFTLAWKHKVDNNFSYYTDIAETINHASAHYDLGAGGRSVTTDCHDASNPVDTVNTGTPIADPAEGGPRCWAGARIVGVSVGMKYTF
jgi:predicted porin